MCDYSRFLHIGVLLVVLLDLNDSLMENLTVVECGDDNCTISCYDGKNPFTWLYSESVKDDWRILKERTTQTITLNDVMHGYYFCTDANSNLSKVFYVPQEIQALTTSVLTAVTVLAVLFGIGFVIMAALALKFYKNYKSSVAKSVGDGVTTRESPPERTYYDEIGQIRKQSSVDEDGYVVPIKPKHKDYVCLEVLSNHRARTPTGRQMNKN